MIANLTPYPAYKASGMGWLKAVPEHWEIRTIKTLFREKDARSRDGKGMLLSLTRAGGIVPHSEVSTKPATASDLSKYKLCIPGDLVMNRMQAWSGMFAVSPYCGLVSPDYSVFTPMTESAIRVQFFERLFKTPMFVDQFAKRSKGIGSGFNRLYTLDFGSVHALSPPVTEQAAIVRFLDHADRRIRRYIRAKERLIELLEEQKQAIIHQAVTGQINVRTGQPYPVYKDSRVEWLGKIPSHWKQCRLRNVVSGVTTGSRGWSSYAAETGPLFIRVTNLSRGSLQLRFDDTVRLDLPATSEAARTRIRGGDLLISVTAYIGSVGIAPNGFEEAYVSQHVARCEPLPGVSAEWLGYLLLSRVGQTHGQMTLYGGTKDGLSLDDVKNYPIIFPPSEEESSVIRWIERKLLSIHKMKSRTKAQIELLREYRTRLIADVVTGKLDVREAAAAMPEKFDEPTDGMETIEHDNAAERQGEVAR